MALRRSLGSVLQSLQRLVLSEGSVSALHTASQPHAAPTLTSLRHFRVWAPQSPASGAAGPAAALGGGRCFAASAAVQQQAAPAAPAAEEESLEQIRARIFGTHIGGRVLGPGAVHCRAGIGSRSLRAPEQLRLQPCWFLAACRLQALSMLCRRRRTRATHTGSRPFAGMCTPPLLASLHAGNGLRSGRKVLRRPLLGAKLAAWYPPDPIKHDPLMLNLKAEA